MVILMFVEPSLDDMNLNLSEEFVTVRVWSQRRSVSVPERSLLSQKRTKVKQQL